MSWNVVVDGIRTTAGVWRERRTQIPLEETGWGGEGGPYRCVSAHLRRLTWKVKAYEYGIIGMRFTRTYAMESKRSEVWDAGRTKTCAVRAGRVF